MFDKQLLLEDLTFPLTYKYGYVWDGDGNMVAMGATDDEVGLRNLIVNVDRFAAQNFVGKGHTGFFTREDGYIYRNGNPLLLLRGWGRLQQKDNPEKRQDNIGDFIVTALNSYW